MNIRACAFNVIKLNNFVNRTEICARNYSRWAHRTPARVLTPEEYDLEENSSGRIKLQPQKFEDGIIELSSAEITIDEHPQRFKNNRNGQKQSTKVVRHSKLIDVKTLDALTHFGPEESVKRKRDGEKKVKYTQDEVLNATFDENGNYVYEKMKDNDPKIGALMLTVKSRKLRKRKECILLEGKRLIKDALEAGCAIQHLLFSRKTDLEFIRHLLPEGDVKLYKMAYRDMQMWSDLSTCPGIMGIFKTPRTEDILPSEESVLPLTVICDNIREPGNLGSILRASVAVGARKIVLSKGCVDLWEPKVLRSSSGAHFRAPILGHLDWPEIKKNLPEDSCVFLADNSVITGSKTGKENLENLCTNVPVLPYYGVNFSDYKSVVLIIGGETLGLSEESYRLAFENKGVRLNIPLNNRIESLNAGTALGILAFEIRRQLVTKR